MEKKKKMMTLIILTVAIIVISIVSYYIYYQNKKLFSHVEETEELSSYIEENMKKDAQDILDRISKSSKTYLPEGNITFDYLNGKHNIEKDTDIITYFISYNGKKTSLSLDFEKVDDYSITKINFNANKAYTMMGNEENFLEIFLTDKEEYSKIIPCLLLSLPDSIDKNAFKYANLIKLYEELHEKEELNMYGYNISVKGYTSNLIVYTFEKVKFSMN